MYTNFYRFFSNIFNFNFISNSQIIFAGATRGGKRGGRSRDDQGDANEYSQTKPSAGVSLFDFLEEKIPGGGGATSKPEDERSKPNSANSRNNGSGGKCHDFQF